MAQRVYRLSRIARAAVLASFFSLAVTSVAAAQQPMNFGIDVAGANTATSKGLSLKYGSLWAGPWNQKYGWGGIETQLQTAKANGLTPVIQWWYWGDDISPTCVEQGCTDRYQGVRKDKATWTRLSNELADLIARVMGPNSNAVVIVETEFNKGGIETYEPFDGYLVEQAAIFRARNQKVVIGFGNWGQSNWTRFDRAAAAADLLGTQVLYSSIREPNTYLTGATALINGATTLKAMFGKPIFVTDFAFSSYPEPAYERNQDIVVQEIFARLSELKAAGVEGMVWRMFVDDPTFDTSNYHGMAERYWGLVRANGTEKAAFFSFVNGMQLDRSGTTGTPPPPPPTAPSAPTGLTAVAGSTQAVLSWSAVSGAASYNVKMSTTSGGPYNTVGAGVTATSFTSIGLANGTTYYYVVSAVASSESVNSAQVSAVPVAPTPPPAPSGIAVWWPTDQAVVSGLQPFKAVLQGYSLSAYNMYWKVDSGQENVMYNSQVDGPHKEAMVDVAGWNWRGQGPYAITFVAKNSKNKVIAQRTVSITVVQ